MVRKNARKIVGTLLFFILSFFSFNLINFHNDNNYINANTNYVSVVNSEIVAKTNNSLPALEDNEVYLGGIPIGIKVGAKGVLITGFNDIITNYGKINIKNFTELKIGDVIKKINNIDINSSVDIENIISNNNNKLDVIYERNSEQFNTVIDIYKDIKLNKNVIGINIKDKVLGIGTLTYVDKNKNFASLGHHILDSDSGASSILNNGNIYNSFIVNSNKSTNNKAGHLNGMIIENSEVGCISKNNCFGLYGKSNDNIVNGLNKIKLGKKEDIVLGKAQIMSTIKGSKPKLYDIEIIKTNYQNFPQERSMVVRVTDKELIAKTGGIVQGMSGSPIIQNGKLVGALTHVFLNDSTKGYGLYIDWMLNN